MIIYFEFRGMEGEIDPRWQSAVEVFDIQDQVWISGPDMNLAKGAVGCCVVDQRVYNIGGWGGGNWIYLDSIEALDISNGIQSVQSYSWIYWIQTLPEPSRHLRALVFDADILLIREMTDGLRRYTLLIRLVGLCLHKDFWSMQ